MNHQPGEALLHLRSTERLHRWKQDLHGLACQPLQTPQILACFQQQTQGIQAYLAEMGKLSLVQQERLDPLGRSDQPEHSVLGSPAG